MWIDILINIGCSIVTSISLSIFIYFKYLKKIPEETKNQINELLNQRLSYETTNHNATLKAIESKSDMSIQFDQNNHNAIMQGLSPNNAHLSAEHSKLLDNVYAIKTKLEVKDDEDIKKRSLLDTGGKAVQESIDKLYSLVDLLKTVTLENRQLKDEMEQVETERVQLVAENKRLKARLQYNKTNTLTAKNQQFEHEHSYEFEDDEQEFD